MEAYIRQKAAELGIDPDIAVRVAKSEGLRENTWQADGMLSYGREQSYGPFQLHNAPAGERPGMGNDFVNATGLNPANPDTWDEGIDFALQQARKGGWGPWFGAKKEGITGMMGIGGEPAPAAPAYAPRPTDTVAQPGAGAMPDPVPGLLDEDPFLPEPDEYAGLAKMGLKVLDKAQKKKAASIEPVRTLMPPVLMPLRNNTKGLL